MGIKRTTQYSKFTTAKRGFALLVAVIFASVVLALGVALGSLGYKQSVLSSSAELSGSAFYAADSGLECALYADQKEANFFIQAPGGQNFECDSTQNGSGITITQTPVTLNSDNYTKTTTGNFSIDTGGCAAVTVYKPDSGIGTTYIFSVGYSAPCTTVNNPGGARFAARGLEAQY